jgi:hypothetical protein
MKFHEVIALYQEMEASIGTAAEQAVWEKIVSLHKGDEKKAKENFADYLERYGRRR